VESRVGEHRVGVALVDVVAILAESGGGGENEEEQESTNNHF